MFSAELDDRHCDALLPVEENDRLGILMKFAYRNKLVLPETFHQSRSSILLFCQVYYCSINEADFPKYFSY